ncbi:hypothetical protein SAMN04489724_4262 [Algoriphagus locisalis]|uniref:Uncharacterized protein n=1 Tax=Algoriphagus locisalis TaxID=305507 RepID=A0A1I7DPS0_9BACT|nr:hypothetical protein [Algoriphagus locisalis]SFU13701.1 hypothetical protein SAMN04489724_4262 [Algoriphagus locisalis]
MGFIEKVESLLEFKFGEFPGPDDLPSDLEFNMKHFEEIPSYSKELSDPLCGLFTILKVRKSMMLTLTSFILPTFSNDKMVFLGSLIENLAEIYGADEKLMLYLLDEEKEKILLGDWAGRYWEFDERYCQMNVSVSLDKEGSLSLSFYKFWHPWCEIEDDDDE